MNEREGRWKERRRLSWEESKTRRERGESRDGVSESSGDFQINTEAMRIVPSKHLPTWRFLIGSTLSYRNAEQLEFSLPPPPPPSPHLCSSTLFSSV